MIEALKNIGFVVTERLERKELSSDLQNRYSELPADYQEFLQRFQTITNESDNVWFNSIEDFNGESDSGFRWNEFELMGLEALADDKESCDMIRLFWDSHIPILINWLQLSKVRTDNLSFLEKTISLQYLRIIGGSFTSIEGLEKCVNLKTLFLQRCTALTNLKPTIASLYNLERLNLEACRKVSVEELKGIAVRYISVI